MTESAKSDGWDGWMCRMQLQTLEMAVGAGPTCTVSAIVRAPNATNSVRAREALCYADWGCRIGESEASMRAACLSHFACNSWPMGANNTAGMCGTQQDLTAEKVPQMRQPDTNIWLPHLSGCES